MQRNLEVTYFNEFAVKFETLYISVSLSYKVLIRLIKISKSLSRDANTIKSDLGAFSIISMVIPTSQSPFENPSERLIKGLSFTSKPIPLKIFWNSICLTSPLNVV